MSKATDILKRLLEDGEPVAPPVAPLSPPPPGPASLPTPSNPLSWDGNPGPMFHRWGGYHRQGFSHFPHVSPVMGPYRRSLMWGYGGPIFWPEYQYKINKKCPPGYKRKGKGKNARCVLYVESKAEAFMDMLEMSFKFCKKCVGMTPHDNDGCKMCKGNK